MYLSVVIPCYNEAGKIEADVTAAVEYFNGRGSPYEIVLVDDGSSDSTPAVLNKLQSKHAPVVRSMAYRPNRGKGCAVRTGMMAAKGDFRMFADAGLCVPFSETEKGLSILRSGADVAIGSRKLQQSRIVEQQAGYRRLGSQLFGFLVRNGLGLRYSDTQCGFKLFTARAAEQLFGAARIDGFMFDAEMLINARKEGLAVKEFAVEWRADPDTRYKPFSGSFRNLVELLRIQLQ